MDYTDLYNFQSSSGMIVPSDSEVLTNIQEKFKEIFGSDLDVSASTPVGRLIEAIALLVKSTLGVNAQSANQFNLNYATGIYLDSLAQLFNITRDPGSRTQVPITVWTVAEDNTVPAGTIVKNTSNELFTIDDEIVPTYQDTDGKWVGTGTATAYNYGPVDGSKGVVNKISSPVNGLEKVENQDSPIRTGTDMETDESLRKRISKSRYSGVCFYQHLMSALSKINGVKSVCILENNGFVDAVKKGVLLGGHSIFVCVEYSEGTDTENEIAKAIAYSRPAGVYIEDSLDPSIAQAVKKTITIDYSGGVVSSEPFSVDVTFYKPTNVYPWTYVKVYPYAYTGMGLEEDVRSAISAYIASLNIGDTLNGMALASAIMIAVPGVTVTHSKVSNDTIEPNKYMMNDSAESYGYQKFAYAADHATVEILSSLS